MMSYHHIRAGAAWPDVFAFFFLLAMAVAVVGVWLYGQKNREEPLSWSLTLATTLIGWLVGSKVYMAFPHLVDAIATGGEYVGSHSKNLLGGIAGAIVAVLAGRRLLGADLRYADAWAFFLPASLLVGRFGCFLAGCCHGNVTAAPWAITYPPGSLSHIHHVNDGLVARGSATSLPVHPAQLYEMVLVLGLLLLATFLRPRLRGRGSLFLTVAGGYSLIRFAQEFTRYGGETWLGLKWVQWGLLAAAIGLFAWAVRRERIGDVATTVIGVGLRRVAWVGGGLLLVAVALSRWFSPLERASLIIACAPAVGHGAARLGRMIASRMGVRWRLMPAGMAAMALATWSPLALQGERPKKDEKTLLVELSGGGGQVIYSEICDDTRYQDRFFDARLTVAHRWKYRLGELLESGVVGYAGYVERLHGPQRGEESTEASWIPSLQGAIPAPYKLVGIQPYVLWDFYWGAVGLGGHLFSVLDEGSGKVMGSGYLRGGPEDIAFIEGGFMWAGAPIGAPVYRVGLGGTLGPAGTLRLGAFAVPPVGGGFYLEPTFNLPLTDYSLELGPSISISSEYFYVGATVGIEVPVAAP